MAYQHLPCVGRDTSSEQLLTWARERPLDHPVGCLEALLLLDSARWIAWPQPATGVDEFEAHIAANAPARSDTAPGRLLALDLAARAAAREGSLEQAAEALNALPSGYAIKSLWLRWRQTLGRHRRAALWDRTRGALVEAVAADGVPASETLAALAGELDLPRWRAQARLQAEAVQRLGEAWAPPPGRPNDPARRVQQAAAGRWLLMLGDEEGGARRLHAATDGLPLVSPTPRGRLFSRPAPDSAAWLRKAVDLAQRLDGGPREALLLSALRALIALAHRHCAGHLLAETLDPQPVRFDQPDATALVLAEGASAWLFCGEHERQGEWWRAAHKLTLRHAKAPLTADAVRALAALDQRLGTSPDALQEVVGRLAADGKLELSVELARVRALSYGFGHSSWDRDAVMAASGQALAGLYRLAKTRHHAGNARAVAAIAGALCDLGQRAAGLTLFACLLASSEGLPASLPEADDEAAARAELAEQIGTADGTGRQVPAMLWSLALHGEPALANALLQRATEADGPPNPTPPGLRATTLAQALAEGCDPGLPAAVDLAVREESQRVIERLRIDDPVFEPSPTTR